MPACAGVLVSARLCYVCACVHACVYGRGCVRVSELLLHEIEPSWWWACSSNVPPNVPPARRLPLPWHCVFAIGCQFHVQANFNMNLLNSCSAPTPLAQNQFTGATDDLRRFAKLRSFAIAKNLLIGRLEEWKLPSSLTSVSLVGAPPSSGHWRPFPKKKWLGPKKSAPKKALREKGTFLRF